MRVIDEVLLGAGPPTSRYLAFTQILCGRAAFTTAKHARLELLD